ncbi:MAG: hypothetical protein ACYCVD_10600 [Desulfitobacteriaceae bacterium]
MKKLNKKIGAIVGTVVLGISIMALPALADTQSGQGNGWLAQMQSYMSQTFSPAQHQQFMNSSAMQNLHNSTVMQQAMQSGDIGKMQSLMNSNPALKAQIGQENIDKMNQIMSNIKQQNIQPGTMGQAGINGMGNGQVNMMGSSRGSMSTGGMGYRQ